EGSAIQDSLSPDRILIGAPNKDVAMKLIELYSTLERPMLITDVRSAEIIKYASNAFLCMKISFINAIADLCELTGADVADVAKGIGADRRIGPEFLSAGLGFGGSCFPKDLESLIKSAEALGYDLRILKEVAAINRERVPRLLKIIREKLSPLEGKTIGVLGLSFKPNTDDMRGAKAVELIRGLLSDGAHVKAYDPVAMENARGLMPEVEYCRGPYEVAEGSDALVIATEWREFLQLNMERLRGLLKRALIFDGRNIYSPEKMRRMNFEYYSVGRP
ncbi:MAG: UDP-glucose dehydrogenase family protein, partial [Nitrospinota bacterium]